MTPRKEVALEKEFLALVENIAKSTPVDLSETYDEQQARIKKLEKTGNEEAWINYYFPSFAFCKSAKFQLASTSRIVKAYDTMLARGFGKFYQSRAWARGLSKSTRRMMEVFYLSFAKKLPTNCLLISKSEKNAQKLLAPYRANMEGNQKLIHDYGKQKGNAEWTAENFITEQGKSFRAVGAEMNPRGSKNDERRINMIIFDDVDDDEVCRNEDRLKERWEWIEKAVIPTVEISKPYFIFFDNNIIAEKCLALKAREKANDKEVINIRDEHGKSTWPEKNNEEMIDGILSDISYESAQGEYFNNPMSQGVTFSSVTWGKCPPLSELPFVVVYADPATSNKEKPNQKSKQLNSRKAGFVVGRHGNRYYIYYGFLDVMGNAKFINNLYACREYVNNQTTAYFYIENNTLQDPFYEQVLLPLIFEEGEAHGGNVLGMLPDTRKKPEKWPRIEALLEPLNRQGRLIFNEEEKGNVHMQRLEAQFKSAKPTSKELDGPDAIEGAVIIINQKTIINSDDSYAFVARKRSSKYE